MGLSWAGAFDLRDFPAFPRPLAPLKRRQAIFNHPPEAAAAARLKRQAEHDARAVERIKPYLVDQGLSCQATADVLNLGGSERHGYTDQMSQELIGIIGAATVAVALATPVHAQVDCADWNTSDFFKTSAVSDVTRCLQAGADLEARDRRGETPLHRAAIAGNAEVVTVLLEAGADPNARSLICQTPLHYAAALWRSETGLALLAAGADPAARSEDGRLPFAEIPTGVADVLRIFGGIVGGGPRQADFYGQLEEGKFRQSTYGDCRRGGRP